MLPFNKLLLREDRGVKYKLLCTVFLDCIFNLPVNEFIMNKSSEVNEDPNGSFWNANLHMWPVKRPLHSIYFPNCLVGCVTDRSEEMSPVLLVTQASNDEQLKVNCSFSEVGFMVGNTTGSTEHANLNPLGIVMHLDLISLQKKIISIYQEKVNLRNFWRSYKTSCHY